MRFYRLHKIDNGDGDGGSSRGFEWFTALDMAMMTKKAWVDESPEDRAGSVVDAIDIKETKAGILAALQCFANHPDNG